MIIALKHLHHILSSAAVCLLALLALTCCSKARQVALESVLSPLTWVPATSAAAIQLGHADQKVSAWASSRTPVYGSRERAEQISDILLQSTGYAFAGTAASMQVGGVAPVIDAVGAEIGAGISMREVVNEVKHNTSRMRPNGGGNVSFPSSHAAGSSLFATLSSRNIETYTLQPATTSALQYGLGAIAGATAWARVEAKQHYPSDVLAGAAIGHFFGAFITGMLFNSATGPVVVPVVVANRDSGMVVISWCF